MDLIKKPQKIKAKTFEGSFPFMVRSFSLGVLALLFPEGVIIMRKLFGEMEVGEYAIPQVIIVGFGRTQALQYKCPKCKKAFFPNQEKELVFCDQCVPMNDFALRSVKKTEVEVDSVFRYSIIDWEQRTAASKRRSNKNYRKVMLRDEFTCQYCRYSPRYVVEFIPLHIDHVVPFISGGSHLMNNLVVACETCNLWLSDKIFNGYNDKLEHITNKRKSEDLPYTERQWREKSGILVGELWKSGNKYAPDGSWVPRIGN